MKNKQITILCAAILMLLSLHMVRAQDDNTTEAKFLDLLAQMPAANQEQTEQVIKEVLEMGEEGILEFANRLVPLGKGNDKQARYLLNSLATYSGGQSADIKESNLVEKALIKAIEAESNPEIQTFLMDRLAFCGSNTTVTYLSGFLNNESLFEPALSTLSSIGSADAAATILKALTSAEDPRKQRPFIKALGELRYIPANEKLIEISEAIDRVTARYALMALAEISSEKSHKTLLKAANASGFNIDDKEAVLAYIHYGNRAYENGNNELSVKVGKNVLKNCVSPDQLHFRSAGINLLAAVEGEDFHPTLVREVANPDIKYRETVVTAAENTLTEKEIPAWIETFNNTTEDVKPQIIRMLGKMNNPLVLDQCILPSLKGTNEATRIEAIKSLVHQDKSKALGLLLETLHQRTSVNEKKAIEETLLRICAKEDNPALSAGLSGLDNGSSVVIVRVLAAREAKAQFREIVNLLERGDEPLNAAVYEALSTIAGEDDLSFLLNLMTTVEGEENIATIQGAIIAVLDASEEDHSDLILSYYNANDKKERVLPVLVALEKDDALTIMARALENGSTAEKTIAIQTLGKWRNNDAIPHLYQAASTIEEEALRASAFQNYLNQVIRSNHPDDQKLLLIKKAYPFCKTTDDKKYVLNAAGKVKTFLSLVFVSQFLDDPALERTASGTAIGIALPTPDAQGLQGDIVRDIVSRGIDNLTGEDSQYLKIDVREFLDNMPKEQGYVSIFNGKDLSGWQGLVDDPIKRVKMTPAQLEKKQSKANADMAKDWVVENGHLKFVGEGFKNICTIKKYGDIDMLLDWKIGQGGDSGVYLRGTPQVQIWDTALTEVGAEVGSGGLYNNAIHSNKPLLVADNPVNDWNTFRIKMIGDKVTVYLNGQLVVDQVVLENYWDSTSAIFPREAIELQAHGENVAFRNIYVKEPSKN